MSGDELTLCYKINEIVENGFTKENVIAAREAMSVLYRYLFDRLLEEVVAIPFDRPGISKAEIIRNDQEIQVRLREGMKNIPCTLQQFFYFLRNEPVCNYLGSIDSQEPFVNRYGIINEKIDCEMEETDIDNMIEKNVMLPLIQECRMHMNEEECEWDYEELYQKGRLYFLRNYYVEIKEFKKYMFKNFPPHLEDIIRTAYREREMDETIEVCPICGARLVMDGNGEPSCLSEACNAYIRLRGLKPKRKELKGNILVLRSAIYKYIALQCIGELEIYNKLKEKKCYDEVTLYPEVDKYDIKVRVGERIIYLDIKDSEDPISIVRLIDKKGQVGKYQDNTVIVILNYRIKAFKYSKNLDYMHLLKNELINYGMNIKIISERHLLSYLKREFQNE